MHRLWWNCSRRRTALEIREMPIEPPVLRAALIKAEAWPVLSGGMASIGRGGAGNKHQGEISRAGDAFSMPSQSARLEHMPIRLSVTRVCKVSFTFAFEYRSEKRGYGFPKLHNGSRLCFA